MRTAHSVQAQVRRAAKGLSRQVRARPLRWRVVAAAAIFLPLTVWAADSARSGQLGPWLFGCVALVLVARLAWLLGRQSSQPRSSDAPGGEPTAATADTAPTPSAEAGSAPRPDARARQRAEDDAAAFSYALSHDLRAPLRVVDGFARILKEDYGRQLDRIGNDHVDRLLGASARMNAMIDAMLSLAQLSSQPLARQPVELSLMAQQVVEDLRRQSPGRQVQVDITPGLRVHGDPLLLRQVVENLLSNAWKYSAKAPAARIWLRLASRDGRTVYEVGDNGAGFDMRAADRLFGLFQRLHAQSEFPGTGIGLASVQRIVRKHGGEIWAEAEPGKGARFYFTIPG